MDEPAPVVPDQRRGPPALDARVEQAKGMLMLSYRIGEHEASELLDGWSASWGVSVRTIASTMVEATATSPADVRQHLVGLV